MIRCVSTPEPEPMFGLHVYQLSCICLKALLLTDATPLPIHGKGSELNDSSLAFVLSKSISSAV